MSDPTPDQSLHLPSLVIKNFRGIDELTIPRLGRVTLLAGKNGVGKTTVLDAVRVWADRGLSDVCDSVLFDRGDSFASVDHGTEKIVVDRRALFTNLQDSTQISIVVGPIDGTSTLRIQQFPPDLEPDLIHVVSQMAVVDDVVLQRQFGDHAPRVEDMRLQLGPVPTAVTCNIIGPNGPSDESVEQYWSEVALTAHEDRALDALNLIADANVERVAALGAPTGNGITQPRRMMAKVTGRDYQVPLRTLGDGAMRTYAIALALAKSSDGFLLIDEAENGIHHSIQAKFWNMVLQTAERNNVQVIATTHSWDCVVGFAQAANELEDVEGLLVRLERPPAGLRAITYDESRLASVTKYDIEVR